MFAGEGSVGHGHRQRRRHGNVTCFVLRDGDQAKASTPDRAPRRWAPRRCSTYPVAAVIPLRLSCCWKDWYGARETDDLPSGDGNALVVLLEAVDGVAVGKATHDRQRDDDLGPGRDLRLDPGQFGGGRRRGPQPGPGQAGQGHVGERDEDSGPQGHGDLGHPSGRPPFLDQTNDDHDRSDQHEGHRRPGLEGGPVAGQVSALVQEDGHEDDETHPETPG